MLNDKYAMESAQLSDMESILKQIGFLSEEEKEEKGEKAGEDYEDRYKKKSGKKSKDYDGDGTVEDETDEYAGVKDRAIKKAMKKEEVEKEGHEDEKADKALIKKEVKKALKKEDVDISSIFDHLTEEDVLFLTDELIEEVVEEFFNEMIEEGFEVEEIETLLVESIDSELSVLSEAKVTLGHDTEDTSPKEDKLAKVKSAIKKVASGAKKVAKKVAGAAGEVAGAAKAGYKKAAGSDESGSSSSGSSSSGGTVPRGTSQKPGFLARAGAALKAGLKKVVGKTARVASKVGDKVATRLGEEIEVEEGFRTIPAGRQREAMMKRASDLTKQAMTPSKDYADIGDGGKGSPREKAGKINDALRDPKLRKEEYIDEKNWIAGAIKHPGAEQKAAKRAGMSTQEYMKKHEHDPGKAGKRARLGLTLTKLSREEVEHIEEDGKMQGGGKDPCWKGYEMVGKKMKGGKEVPNCVPKEEYEELYLDMIEEGYTIDQVREVLAAYEDGFEVIFEEDGYIINDEVEILDEEFLQDVEILADWLHEEGIIENEDEFFELMEDLSEEEIQELYDVVFEATAMAKRGYDETKLRQRAGGGEAADRATALENKPTYGDKNKAAQRQNYARKQRGDFRNTASSNPGLHVGGHKSNDPKVKAKQAARGAQRGALTPKEKKDLNMGYEMIGDSLDNGGLEVTTYSWREVLEGWGSKKSSKKK